MHSSNLITTFLTLALPPLIFAAPATSKHQSTASSGAVTLIAAHSASPVHLQSIAASNSSFFIGKPTVSYCPLEEYGACPAGNITALEVSNGSANLDVAVPGGQEIYVLPTGALSFVPAHTEGTPVTKNGTTTGFSYVNGTAAGELGRFQFEEIGSKDEGGWLACPVNASAAETGPWQVFASIPTISNGDVPGKNVTACIGFDALGSPFEGGVAAWQYDGADEKTAR